MGNRTVDKQGREVSTLGLSKYKVGVVSLVDYGLAAEVVDYAYDKHLSIGQAIIALVTDGLQAHSRR